MVSDRRVTFVHKWLGRAQAEEDEFDRFFAAWIALVVAAQRVRDLYGGRIEEDTDRRRVVDYFRYNKEAVLAAAGRHEADLRQLARRRGQGHRNPIVDTGNPNLRRQLGCVAAHYGSGGAHADEYAFRDEIVKVSRCGLLDGAPYLPILGVVDSSD